MEVEGRGRTGRWERDDGDADGKKEEGEPALEAKGSSKEVYAEDGGREDLQLEVSHTSLPPNVARPRKIDERARRTLN